MAKTSIRRASTTAFHRVRAFEIFAFESARLPSVPSSSVGAAPFPHSARATSRKESSRRGRVITRGRSVCGRGTRKDEVSSGSLSCHSQSSDSFLRDESPPYGTRSRDAKRTRMHPTTPPPPPSFLSLSLSPSLLLGFPRLSRAADFQFFSEPARNQLSI